MEAERVRAWAGLWLEDLNVQHTGCRKQGGPQRTAPERPGHEDQRTFRKMRRPPARRKAAATQPSSVRPSAVEVAEVVMLAGRRREGACTARAAVPSPCGYGRSEGALGQGAVWESSRCEPRVQQRGVVTASGG